MFANNRMFTNNITSLVSAAGFSAHIEKLVPLQLVNADKCFLTTIDEPNLLRFMLEDFTKNTENLQSLNYTNLNLDSLMDDEEITDSEAIKINTVGPGIHLHNKHSIYLFFESCDSKSSLINTSSPKYTSRCALVTSESLKTIQDYLQSIRKQNHDDNSLKLHIVSEGCWRQNKIKKRYANTLYTGKLWPKILADAQDFFALATEDWFNEHGINYVRTYIFTGPPGVGKSCCIKALASELNLPLYSLNLSYSNLDDQTLIDIVQDVEKKCIVCIEDVERLFNNHNENITASSVSFSTLLNILDGNLSTKSGIMFVLSCNDYEKLDNALKRCGRVDSVYKFPFSNLTSRQQIWEAFYPNKIEEQKQFIEAINSIDELPCAVLQEFFIQNRKRNATEAIKNLDVSFFKKRKTEINSNGYN
jgi:hypothetical protein